jgi:hypothetical protein
MTNDDVTKAMWHELRVNPPERITQEPFDRSDRHLRRLRRLVEGDRAEASDLVPYTQDLLYTAIQSDLFAYLLPFCLEAWRSNLRGTSSEYGGFVEYFYPVLARREILATHLTPRQQLVTSDFMRRAILDEIDAQRGLSFHGARTRVYRWFAALATHGVLFPETRKLWTDWWSLNTVGGAVASVQYISCLMYPETENPIFAPWTREEGGGPPCLWEFAGHLYTHCWLPQMWVFWPRHSRRIMSATS